MNFVLKKFIVMGRGSERDEEMYMAAIREEEWKQKTEEKKREKPVGKANVSIKKEIKKLLRQFLG